MNNGMVAKLEMLEGVGLILELCNLIRMNHKEIKNTNRPIISKRLSGSNNNKKMPTEKGEHQAGWLHGRTLSNSKRIINIDPPLQSWWGQKSSDFILYSKYYSDTEARQIH